MYTLSTKMQVNYFVSHYIYIYIYIYIHIYVCVCVDLVADGVYIYVNDLVTGQLWARDDTEESSHVTFQAIWTLVHKYTDGNHTKSTANLTFYSE